MCDKKLSSAELEAYSSRYARATHPDAFETGEVGRLLATIDAALSTLARLREHLPKDVLERAEVCARTMRCMTGMAMLAQTYADTAEALHAAAALLWPGEG